MSNVSTSSLDERVFDYAVIGGGTAGCVLANRLSADPSRSVVLIEAGVREVADAIGCPLRDSSRLILEGYNWDYEAQLIRARADGSPARSPKSFPYRLGKTLGGSSAVNGAVALIGFASDFDRWAAAGCTVWGWSDVEPWFRAIDGCERRNSDAAIQSPLRLRFPEQSQLHSLDRAFIRACVDAGVPFIDCINRGEEPAVGLSPANVGPAAERINLFQSYVQPVLHRPNLVILTEAMANRVKTVGNRATGVEISQSGRALEIHSRNVVLSAGAVGTPLLLQRSGIGDAPQLRSLDIPIVSHLPAIGKNLSDHASVVLWAVPKSKEVHEPRPWRQVVARTPSGIDKEIDVQLGLLNNVVSERIPAMRARTNDPALIGATVMLMRPEARGRVAWRGPRQPPLIELPVTSSEVDVARLAGGVRQMWRLLQHPDVKENVESVRFWSEAVVANDDTLRSAVSNLANPGWHACGTVRMGSKEDKSTAVDERGAVHGLRGLFVSDASIFPSIPSMPTNLTVIMTAERIADFILNGSVR
ncbi:hypothetical protein BJF93_23100 [Xaviernesmea oryzae]|uniref:Glucose-methanol-choline oxidoreductase N-terminal domain-containing protein n=1 Tax=Xaviernesmea oryzae TaxID=464029 RepID=A0A1Q9AU09_9HYPH|nr:GMC family oxidoreductase [Xaviernesmea oryzae]OLP58917.1 hypothetical protein BJF93_23100 [Xaviernesmea oryzae]SEM01932.1 choline dehydrogenase [Xaviernesmea oryzae]